MNRGTIMKHVLDTTGRYDKTEYLLDVLPSVCNSIARVIDSAEDLVEEVLPVDVASLIHNVALQDTFLKVAYLRPLPFRKMLDPIVPSRAMKDNRELVNVYYRSGRTLVVRLATAYKTTQLAFGWYSAVPVMATDTAENWIAKFYPEVLINMLSSRAYAITGDTDAANAAQAAASLTLAEYKNSGGLSGASSVLGSSAI